jgi:long-chain acyl-CoA synthetase
MTPNVIQFPTPRRQAIQVSFFLFHWSFLEYMANIIVAHYRNAIIRDLPTPGGDPNASVSTTYEVFEVTVNAHPKYKCLGHRPINSGNVEDPKTLQFKHEFVWQTYGEVAQRRLNLGSAIQALFNDGTIGGGELPTVGTWSINRPGKISS